EGRAVVHAHGELAGHGVADMAMLAGFRARDGAHVRLPAPAGLEDEAADVELVERDYLHDAVREPPNFVGAAEPLALKPRHVRDLSRRRPRIPEGDPPLPDRLRASPVGMSRTGPRPGSLPLGARCNHAQSILPIAACFFRAASAPSSIADRGSRNSGAT